MKPNFAQGRATDLSTSFPRTTLIRVEKRSKNSPQSIITHKVQRASVLGADSVADDVSKSCRKPFHSIDHSIDGGSLFYVDPSCSESDVVATQILDGPEIERRGRQVSKAQGDGGMGIGKNDFIVTRLLLETFHRSTRSCKHKVEINVMDSEPMLAHDDILISIRTLLSLVLTVSILLDAIFSLLSVRSVTFGFDFLVKRFQWHSFPDHDTQRKVYWLGMKYAYNPTRCHFEASRAVYPLLDVWLHPKRSRVMKYLDDGLEGPFLDKCLLSLGRD